MAWSLARAAPEDFRYGETLVYKHADTDTTEWNGFALFCLDFDTKIK